jgi:hypothetical protein
LSFLSAPAEARTITVRLLGSPTMTLTVPPGWRAVERGQDVVFTRGSRRYEIATCRLERGDRDMSGRTAARRNEKALAVRGGGCIRADSRAFARRLKPVLGRGGPAPKSDAAAEQLARAARERTLAQPRAAGTAAVTVFGWDVRIAATWEYDLLARYEHQFHTFGTDTAEVIFTPGEYRLRDAGETCWGFTSAPEQDDAISPRLDLQEWDAPPSTKTSWHVSYAPVERRGDVSVVRWTAFVADGEAEIGPDGLLRRVVIRDHHMARGRTIWRTVEVVFTGFPAAIPPVRPEPSC